MTKVPHENWNVKPAEGRPYKVGPYCSVPGCGRVAEHAHHIWRRSFTGKAAAWVVLWDGKVVGNLTGLCVRHHDQVTGGVGGHQAAIIYEDECFFWEAEEGPHALSLLDPQPPGTPLSTPLGPDSDQSAAKVSAEGSVERGACPTCGRVVKPKEELAPGEKRPKKNWTVSVPVDERENGVEVIESLLMPIAEKLGRAEHRSWRYYTLVEVLVFANQHTHKDWNA